MVNIILAMARPNLDAARRRYETSVVNGKKGAEFGKLGGAPKGNQNARKKQHLNQPQKQPLDVDDNADIEEDVNVNEEEDVNEDAPSGAIGFNSSFSNSSIGCLEEIVNESERLEQSEEKKEPMQEVNQYHSNELRAGAANQEKEEKPSYSKSDNLDSAAVSPVSDSGKEGAAARHQPKDEGGMDMSDYLKLVINKSIIRLADMKLQGKEYDKQLLNGTIDNMIYYDYHFDRSSAYAAIMKSIEQYNSNRS